MFVPSDEALKTYWETGGGEFLKDRFGSWENVPDYVIDDLSVSGHHACVEEEHGILTLIDQGSLNKILFGGRPVEKVEITDRMEVSLGNTKIRFGKEEKAAMHTVAYQKNSFAEEWY